MHNNDVRPAGLYFLVKGCATIGKRQFLWEVIDSIMSILKAPREWNKRADFFKDFFENYLGKIDKTLTEFGLLAERAALRITSIADDTNDMND